MPHGPGAPDAGTEVRLGFTLDLLNTLAPLAHGRGDPTIRLGRRAASLALRTPDGPATLSLRQTDVSVLLASAWGPAAEAALLGVAELVGQRDEPDALAAPRDPLIRQLQRRFRGLRLPRTGRVLDALLPAILEQKVTGIEARRAYRALVRRWGEPAPGPEGLWLRPSASVLAELPYHAYHPLGVERRRAELIRAAARRADRLEGLADPAVLAERLRAIPGIGPWTVAEVLRVTHGDPDALSVGDYHLRHQVAWALAGEARGTDERMLELLEPYRGQRGRVQRLIEVGAIWPPKFGPRMAPRSIAAL
jgi:3-methyladenine DNA glycosylase/8-oxoguanine DNA glycosylase